MGARALLSGDEGTGTLAAVRGLHAGGYEVLLALSREGASAARSRCAAGVVRVPAPEDGVKEHARAVAAVAARGEARLVLPGTEGSLRALTGHEALFTPGTVVATAPREALDRATNKLALGALARVAGLRAPETIALPPGGELPAGASFPAVLKPLRSRADAGGRLWGAVVRRVADAGALRALLAREGDGPWLLQPLIEGTLAAVCGVAWRGELVCAVHQRSPRIWPPGVGISSYATTVAPDPERERGVAALLAALRWSGVFGVQFLECGDQAYVIDLNPRIYGSLSLALAAGLNLPAIWADLALGRSPRVGGYRAGVHYRVEEDDVRAIAHALRHGPARRAALAGLLPRRHTTHALFSLRDPRPLLSSAEKLARRWR
jgi:predicted ATP-grasp superfamily ATP-dependent carboligase